MEYQITKILIISFFSSILISLFLNTRYIIFFKKFSKNKKILLNLFIYSFSSLILIFINYLLSLNGLTSLIIFNAAIITTVYKIIIAKSPYTEKPLKKVAFAICEA